MNKRILTVFAAIMMIAVLAFSACGMFKEKEFDGEVYITEWPYGLYATAPLEAKYNGSEEGYTYEWRMIDSSAVQSTQKIFYPEEEGEYNVFIKKSGYGSIKSSTVTIAKKPLGIEFFGEWTGSGQDGGNTFSNRITIDASKLVITQAGATFTFTIDSWANEESNNPSTNATFGSGNYPKGRAIQGTGATTEGGSVIGVNDTITDISLFTSADHTKMVRNFSSANPMNIVPVEYENQDSLRPQF